MSARFFYAGKKRPRPIWGPPGPFFAWAGKIQKLPKFCLFSLVGPWALFTRFGALAAIRPRWGNRYAIICGVLHSGSCDREPTDGTEDEDIDPRAERPLMFGCHELVSGTPIAADHAMVTFLHRCHAPGGPTALISRDWEKHMLPYANSPGKDVGITDDDYAWLLRQCKAGLPSATEPYHSPVAGMSCSYQC